MRLKISCPAALLSPESSEGPDDLPVNAEGIPERLEMGAAVVVNIDGFNLDLADRDLFFRNIQKDIHFVFVAVPGALKHQGNQ